MVYECVRWVFIISNICIFHSDRCAVRVLGCRSFVFNASVFSGRICKSNNLNCKYTLRHHTCINEYVWQKHRMSFWPVLTLRPITWFISFYNSPVVVELSQYVYVRVQAQLGHSHGIFAAVTWNGHIFIVRILLVFFPSHSAFSPCEHVSLCLFSGVWKWEKAVKLFTTVSLICRQNWGNNTVSN